MILIDAIFINNGGGKVLLDYLINELEQTDLEIHYLLDLRIVNNNYVIKSTNNVTYIDSGLNSRYKFYKANRSFFKKVLVLGNVPPPVRTGAHVITYFHNLILLKVPREFNWIKHILYFLKAGIIRMTRRNTDLWLVQSESVRESFSKKLDTSSKVEVLPFFPVLKSKLNITRENGSYIYVSNAQENKNHARLIIAFCKAFDRSKRGKLRLTVSEQFPEIIKLISDAVGKGYPIENLGFITRAQLAEYYMKSEYVIYPSLSESFGLGLVEGALLGCKIIGADLAYTFAVCIPSLTFNPSDELDIENTIVSSLENCLPETELKVENKINELLTLLS